VLTPLARAVCSYAVPRAAYEKREKCWIRLKKCIAKILVNGSNLARVNRKPKPRVAPRFSATGRAGAALRKIARQRNEIARKLAVNAI
jgi:hypothetical protein